MRIIRNPAFAGKKPGLLVVDCHDGTPFLSIEAACGHSMHLHESALPGFPNITVATLCPVCRCPLFLPVEELRAAFQQMRDEGWIE